MAERNPPVSVEAFAGALAAIEAAARAEQLPLSAYGAIGFLRTNFIARMGAERQAMTTAYRVADVERVDIEDDGFITVVPKVRDAGV